MLPGRAALLTTTLALTALVGGVAGCCPLVGTDCRAPPAADAGPPPADFPDLVAATPGCDPHAIRDNGDGSVCATCAGSDAICGAPDVARCEARENAAGVACSFCATAGGDILFDSCYGQDPVSFDKCETTTST